jgi:hypothetical protein
MRVERRSPPSRCRAHRTRGGFLLPACGRRVCARRRAVGTANNPGPFFKTGRTQRRDRKGALVH